MTANSMFTADHQLPIKLIKQIDHIIGSVPIKANLQRTIDHGYEPSGSINNSPCAVHILLQIVPAYRHSLHLPVKEDIANSSPLPAKEKAPA